MKDATFRWTDCHLPLSGIDFALAGHWWKGRIKKVERSCPSTRGQEGGATVQIPILIEPMEGGRYRARAGEPFGMTAEGETKLEAYRKLEELIQTRLRNGAMVVILEVTSGDRRTLCAGSLANNPLFDEWQAIIAENRHREEMGNP
jgi:hypothetical protein